MANIRETIESRLAGLLEPLEPEDHSTLVRLITELVEEARDEMRAECVETCRRRAELWRTTTSATSGPGPGREEARARANEAQYLADLFEAGAAGAMVN